MFIQMDVVAGQLTRYLVPEADYVECERRTTIGRQKSKYSVLSYTRLVLLIIANAAQRNEEEQDIDAWVNYTTVVNVQ